MIDKYVVGFDFVKSYGGHIYYLPLLAGFPFSMIIKKILDTATSD